MLVRTNAGEDPRVSPMHASTFIDSHARRLARLLDSSGQPPADLDSEFADLLDQLSIKPVVASPARIRRPYFPRPGVVVDLFGAAKHVYVSELPALVDEGMIRKSFRRFGRIDDIRLSKSKATGQLNGVAYIKFTYADAVAKALGADGHIPVGSKKVRVARTDPMDSPTRKLFFANVWDMTEEDVVPICQQFGTVVQVDVVADRGMMYVHFAGLSEAIHAHDSLQGLNINHRYVRVEFGQSTANYEHFHHRPQLKSDLDIQQRRIYNPSHDFLEFAR